MTNKVLFQSAQYIKDNTVINNNVDDELIEPFITMAMNKHIESTIGTSLFDELLLQITNSSVTPLNKILLDDYIQPTLMHWTVYEALPFLNYKLTNKSISKKNSDNSVPSDLGEMQYLRTSVRDTSEYYTQRIINYLKANRDDYPAYGMEDKCDDIRPDNDAYFGGIYLG